MKGRADDEPITDEEWRVARRFWPNDEATDFTIHTGNAVDGTTWTILRCSQHGNVQASVQWDLGMLNIAAETHYIRRHIRPAARGEPVAQPIDLREWKG